jgi:hypothetical protein
MRLTLRTLLAYLDDILEPSQTKEIGSKLTESKFASDLVERIREVMRRRRLSAPEVETADGSLDANVMAGYLDNTLPPDKVTEVEKTCLESDVHLAEAAACHQILTMVLGEPVEIAPDSRRRMYGLVSQGSGDNHALIAANQPAVESPERDELDDLPTPTQAQERTEKITSVLPDYLRPRPFWQRALAIALPISLAAVFLILFFGDPNNNFLGRWFGGSEDATKMAAMERHPADRPIVPKAAANAGGQLNRESIPNAAESAAGGGATKLAGPAAPGNGSVVIGKDGKSAPLDSNPANVAKASPGKSEDEDIAASVATGGLSPAAVPGAAQSSPPDMTARIPENSGTISPGTNSVAKPLPEVASITNARTGAPPTPPTPGIPGSDAKPHAASTGPVPPASAKPGAETPLDVRLISKSGVLLGYDPNRDDWFVLERPSLRLPAPAEDAANNGKGDPAGQLVTPTPPVPMAGERRADLLASPEPFDNQLDIGDGLCRMWILGGSSARLLAPGGTSRFGIDVREGRIVLRSGSQKNPGTVYSPLIITLVVRGEQWQLEFLRPETQCGIEITSLFPTRPGEDAKEVGYRGGLYVVSGDIRFTESVGRQRTLIAGRWISLAPGDLAVATDLAGSSFRGKGTPAWLNPELRRTPPSLQRLTRDFEAGFLTDQPVSLSIGTIAKSDRNPKIAELAAKTLALTRQYPTLVEVLAQVPHDEAVEAAAKGLRAWLVLAPNHVTLLQKELSTVYVPAVEDIVLRLLWGYNSDDARSLETSKQLVEWLDSDNLAIRVLAIDQISELTGGQTMRYRGGMKASERRTIKRQWEGYVEKNKGLVRK